MDTDFGLILKQYSENINIFKYVFWYILRFIYGFLGFLRLILV